MLKFKYTVTINALPAYGDKQLVEHTTGEIEALDHSQAKTLAQSRAFTRCKQLEKERGDIFGYEHVQVEFLSVPAQTWTVQSIVDLIKKMIAQAAENERKFAQLSDIGQAEYQESARIEMQHCAGQKIALQVLLSEIVGNDLPEV
jgi:hypothetical protein